MEHPVNRKMLMKVVICNNSDLGTWQLRRGLIKGLIARGIDVTLLTPDGPYVPKLKSLGAKHVAVPFYQFANPLRDLRLCFTLYRALRAEKPDIIQNISIKPNVYGALAAWAAGVPQITSLVCGAGYAFLKKNGWRHAILQRIARTLYWLAGKVTTRVWFVNADDRSLFVESGLLAKEKAVLIVSEGIDLRHFSPDDADPDALSRLRDELGIDASTRVVLMAARVTWSKGVRAFVEASEQAARWDRPVLFVLAGPLAPDSPDPVPETYIRSKASPRFKWLGFRSDMKDLLSLADVVTLPSYYREGLPTILMEGLAMRKPIVTTDSVGCRDVVDEGKNGFLVPVRDSAAFASAIEKLVSDDVLRTRFGTNSRAKAEAEFDQTVIVARAVKEVYQLDDDFQDDGTPGLKAAA
jgi:N,N'-diacetylbacillosaminyl-diphospho-undecaprenol alpha-1,3-N-acetylgalactosaminyltransferase